MICPSCETTVPDCLDRCPNCGCSFAGAPIQFDEQTSDQGTECTATAPARDVPPESAATPGEPGRYVILRKLGSGGMGIVYMVYDHKMERMVAVKRLNPGKENQGGIARFFNEAKAIARLNHTNIVSIFDIVEDRKGFFIVMELVKGVSLRIWGKQHGALPPGKGASIMRQVAEALAYAHKRQIVHRDVKPGNIIVGQGLIPKILDFGVAVIGENDVSAPGKVAGTRGYMAPEVRWNRGASDTRADVYSFGMTMIQAFTGKKPWLVTKYPEPFTGLIIKATKEDPADRYESMEALLADLRQVEEDVKDDLTPVPQKILDLFAPQPKRRDLIEVRTPGNQGEMINLERSPLVLGRSHERCHVYLDDTEISRVHLKIVRDDADVYAFDLCSHNGTYVAGQPVKAVKLKEGLELRIGNTILRYL